MWRSSKQPSIGRLAFFALVLRQALSRMTSLVYRMFHSRSAPQRTNSASVNGNL
jgi:hypothetical protein